jgi:hypothetical protein
MSSLQPAVRIFQIYYSAETRAYLTEGHEEYKQVFFKLRARLAERLRPS